MITLLYYSIIKTTCSAVNATSYLSNEGFEFDDALKLMTAHNTINMLYYGLKNSETKSA